MYISYIYNRELRVDNCLFIYVKLCVYVRVRDW
jgi:hypothetical protein